MSVNSMANRATGGQSEGNRHCRHPVCNDRNIISYLRYLSKNRVANKKTAHKVRSKIAELFRKKNCTCMKKCH